MFIDPALTSRRRPSLGGSRYAAFRYDTTGANAQELAAELRVSEKFGNLVALGTDRSNLFLVYLARDWLLILVALYLAMSNRWATPLAVLAVGERQRALGNLLHECTHGLLVRRRSINDLVGQALLAPALFTRLVVYRQAHLAHHQYLGDRGRDPDFIHDYRNVDKSALRILMSTAKAQGTFSLMGRHRVEDKARIVIWWCGVEAVVFALLGLGPTIWSTMIWLCARLTVFRLLSAFQELTDHTGLCPGSTYGFTRNGPTTGWLRRILHPYNSGYHLTHHLAPYVPWYRLPEANTLMMASSTYREAFHCGSYFAGPTAAVKGWRGLYCEPGEPGQL